MGPAANRADGAPGSDETADFRVVVEKAMAQITVAHLHEVGFLRQQLAQLQSKLSSSTSTVAPDDVATGGDERCLPMTDGKVASLAIPQGPDRLEGLRPAVPLPSRGTEDSGVPPQTGHELKAQIPGGVDIQGLCVVPSYPSRHSGRNQSKASQGSLRNGRSMTTGTVFDPAVEDPTNKLEPYWQWSHRTGWKNYDQKSSDMIESAYQRGDSKARLKSGKEGCSPMEIFFVDMIQHDTQTNNKRDVRRIGTSSWWHGTMRRARSYLRAWETGRPRNESWQSYHDRAREVQRAKSHHPARTIECQATLAELYDQETCAARISGSERFKTCATLLVALNAIWIAVELDNNKAAAMTDADIGFQLMENIFCTLFTLEVILRFAAYRHKRDSLTDGWFVFDGILVMLMILEVWLVPLALLMAGGSRSGTPLANVSVLRLARMMRLTRMVRLFRALPELMTLLKGMACSVRPVSVTLLLLMVFVYIFGIICASQVEEGSELQETYFPSVAGSMWSLLLFGTFLDGVADIADDIRKSENYFLLGVFFLSVLITSLTVLNMLIGIVCELISSVKQEEQERMAKKTLATRLYDIFVVYDRDDSETLRYSEFALLMNNPEVIEVLHDFDVDVKGLETLAEVIFEDDAENHAKSFDEILDLVVRLRGNNASTVEDIVQLRQYVKNQLDKMLVDTKADLVSIARDIKAQSERNSEQLKEHMEAARTTFEDHREFAEESMSVY